MHISLVALLVAFFLCGEVLGNPRSARQLFPDFDGIAESFFSCHVSALGECPASNHSSSCSSLISSFFEIAGNGTVPEAPPTRPPRTRRPRPLRPTTPGPDYYDESSESAPKKNLTKQEAVVRDLQQRRNRRQDGADEEQVVNDGEGRRGRGQNSGRRHRFEVKTDPDLPRKKVCCFLLGMQKMRSECCSNLKQLCSDMFIEDVGDDSFGSPFGRGPFGGRNPFGDNEYDGGEDFDGLPSFSGVSNMFSQMMNWFRRNNPF